MTSTDTWCCSAGICASRPPPSTAAPIRGWPARAPAASPRTTRCRRGPGPRWPGRGLLSTSGGRACSVSSLILVLVSHFYAPSSGFNYLTFKWLFRKPSLENLCNILSSSQCCLKSEQSQYDFVNMQHANDSDSDIALALPASVWVCCVVMLSMSFICNAIVYTIVSTV